MPIRYYEDKKMFKLDTPGSTAVLQVYDEGYLLGLYYGKPIPDLGFDGYTFRDYFASFCPRNERISDPDFSPDVFPLEYSGFGTGDFRPCAVAVTTPTSSPTRTSTTTTSSRWSMPGLPITAPRRRPER